MAKVGLFFGSSTGNTETAAYNIKDKLAEVAPGTEVDVFNIGATTPDQIMKYDNIVFGIPTWNTGELQDDWAIFTPKLSDMNFKGKRVAIFGLGDQNGYGYNFLDAVGILGDEVLIQEGELVGYWPVNTYEFEESIGQDGDYFMGLGIDEDGQESMTEARIATWCDQIRQEFGL